jgi:uncharacterized membrane protein
MKQLFPEKELHLFFEISIIVKGVLAALEVIGGVVVFVISQHFITRLVLTLTQDELSEDKNDFIANYLVNASHNFSLGAAHFIGLYLASHGLIKLLLIIGLLKNKLWAYPLSLVVFALFIIYQIYRYSFTHSPWLVLITVLDLVVIWLVWHEYKYLRTKMSSS